MTTMTSRVEGREGARRLLAERRSPLGEVGRFLALAFAGSWLVAGTALVVLDLGDIGLGIGVLMVAIAALVCTRRDEGSVRPMVRRIVQWRLGLQWYAAALLLPFAALGLALLLGARWGDPGAGPDAPGWSMLLMLPLFVLLFGGPEELGWRGYVLPRLQVRFDALVATLVLALIWMLWHVPVFVATDLFADVPVLPYLVVGIASSFAYTWLYNSTGGSILAVMLLHGSKNLSLAWLLTPLAYTLYAGAWVVVAVGLLIVCGRTHLSRAARHRIGEPEAESAAEPRP